MNKSSASKNISAPGKTRQTPGRAVHARRNQPKQVGKSDSLCHVVKKSVQLNATPNEVWEALTNPEKTKKYFFNCEVYSDWKKGSPITFKGRLFLFWPIEMHGEIVRVEPQELLKYTLHNKGSKGKPSSTSIVTDELSFSNGITTLSITDDVGKEEGAEERFKRSEKGWDNVLAGLKKVVEKK